MFITVERLRTWQVRLMEANDTVEVVHLHDAWELNEDPLVIEREEIDVVVG